jgi:outer membrane protein TolC
MDARRLLLASVATAYFVAQLAREDIAIASADETFNRRQIDEAKARLRVGTGSLSDVLNFEVQVNSARSQLIRAKRVYNVAMIGLATLLGIREARFPANIELARLEPETEEELIAPSPDPQIRYALTHRPDIRQSDYTVKRAKSEVGIARAKFYPVLNATGSVDGERTGSAEFENDDFGGSVGLNLTYNLFAGGLNRAQLAEAKSRLTEADRNLNDASIQVASEVQEAVANLIAGQEQLALQRKNARLVRQNRDLVEKEYNAGQASLVRLNEAQRDLTTAQSQLVLALVSLRQTWENLRAVTGENLISLE